MDNNSYLSQNSKQKPFVKIDTNLYDKFKHHKLSLEARYAYTTLAQIINLDGNKVKHSNKFIEELLEVKRRVRERIIKELVNAKFMSVNYIPGEDNTYELLIGVYKGIRKEFSAPNARANSQNNPVRLTHTNVQGTQYIHEPSLYSPHVRMNKLTCSSYTKNYKIQDKLQHVSDDVFFEIKNSLNANSAFIAVSIKSLRSFANTFGLELLKKRIKKLDDYGYTPEKIESSVEGLLYKALKYGDKWDMENKSTREIKKREEKIRAKKETERKLFEQEAKETARKNKEYGEDERIYSEAKKDIALIENAKAILEITAPCLERNNPALFEGRLKYKIIELYKKQRTLA
jgi:hypothetical protein